MAGRLGPYSVSYSYDAQGRLTHTSRRIFDREDEIEIAYNEHGDAASEITRRAQFAAEGDSVTSVPVSPSYSEVRHSYRYDQHENWIEKTDSYSSTENGEFKPSSVTKRTLTYY
jgi:hypothetical protein